LGFSAAAFGSDLAAPNFKNGDWWKVRIMDTTMVGANRGGACFESYDEYLVKIDGGRKVFVGNNFDKEIGCSEVSGRLLGAIKRNHLFIPFPLKLGEEKTFRTEEFPFETVSAKYLSVGTIKIGEATLETAEMIRTAARRGKGNLFFEDILSYSVKCKCVVVFDRTRSNEKTQVNVKQKMVVTEFGTTE
jgi:hypothetical protein